MFDPQKRQFLLILIFASVQRRLIVGALSFVGLLKLVRQKLRFSRMLLKVVEARRATRPNLTLFLWSIPVGEELYNLLMDSASGTSRQTSRSL